MLKRNRNFLFKTSQETDVDIVYTWVNMNDSKWLKKKMKYTGIKPDKKRYQQHDEIYFSLETVRIFIPYIRNIFIVTDNQKLIKSKIHKDILKKIIMIDHTDIIDKKYLPTFNSNTIEAFLWKIPNLSENFIYSNDDTFFGNFLYFNHIYNNRNVPYTYLRKTNRDITQLKDIPDDQPWLHWARNSHILLKELFGQPPMLRPIHMATFWNKTACKTAIKLIGKKRLRDQFSMVRNNKNIQWPIIYQVTGIVLGLQILGNINNEMLLMKFDDKESATESSKELFEKKPILFAINDINEETENIFNQISSKYLKKFLVYDEKKFKLSLKNL